MVVGYLDASSGSMVVGAIAAAGAGVAVAAKVGWKRVTGVFGGKNKDAMEPATDTSEALEAEPDVAAGTAESEA